MGKVTKIEINDKAVGSAELTARIKKKGKRRFNKSIILKGKGVKENGK